MPTAAEILDFLKDKRDEMNNRKEQIGMKEAFIAWIKKFNLTRIAVEGVAGAGKTTLVPLISDAITHHVNDQFFIKSQYVRPSGELPWSYWPDQIKRPFNYGPAAWLLKDPDAQLSQIQRALDEEGLEVERMIREEYTDGQPFTVIDRHWLTACVNQHPDNLDGKFAVSKDMFGEPELWVIMAADWRVIHERMTTRDDKTPRNIDRACKNTDPFTIGGRLAAFEYLTRFMRSPVLYVMWDHFDDAYQIKCHNIYNDGEFHCKDMAAVATLIAATAVELAGGG